MRHHPWRDGPPSGTRGAARCASAHRSPHLRHRGPGRGPRGRAEAAGPRRFADSALLNLLIFTHQTGMLRIVTPSQQVRRLFGISGVDSVLEIRQTIEETVAP